MNTILKTHDLTKRYGSHTVLNHVNIHIQKGDIYGLIGKNGAGKTTLMKLICGLAAPSEGSLELFDYNDLQAARRKIGCVIEYPSLFPKLTARQNLVYYSKLLGLPTGGNLDELLDFVGLGDVQKKKTGKFSLGMKQRLSIAISLLDNPEFLVLDEPMNGLDPAGIHEIRELLLKLNQEKHTTILISSHILGELSRISTRYGIVDKGQLIDEFTSDELNVRCRKSLHIDVDDIQKADKVLSQVSGSTAHSIVGEHTISVYDRMDDAAKLNKDLVENGIAVSRLVIHGNDLEAYFMQMTGPDEPAKSPFVKRNGGNA